MAKCNNCGKKGIFLRVNSLGVCSDCVRNVELQIQESELKASIAEKETLLADKEKLYNDTLAEMKSRALGEIQAEIDEKTAALATVSDELDKRSTQLSEMEINLNQLQSKLDSNEKKLVRVKKALKAVNNTLTAYEDTYPSDIAISLSGLMKSAEEMTVDALLPTVELPLNCMNTRDLRKLYKQNEKLIDETLKKYMTRYTTKSNAAIYKLMVIALRSELQNILTDLKYEKLEKAVENVKSMTSKYLSITIEGNRSIAPTVIKFIGEIDLLFKEAVKIEYEYLVQKERAREQQRFLREQMRQEAEERKQLEKERKKIESEEEKFKNQIETINQQIAEAGADEDKIHQLNLRLTELTDQIALLEEKKEEIVKLQHGKAGNVYIISNLGSFGDTIFKIGMTRRLDPNDRINELGSASVPFPFDVHSFIFSDDAVGLERDLHAKLHNQRVNKVNLRKEFFRVTLDELEKLVYECQPTAEFNRTMLALQYNQSLSIEYVPEGDISEMDDEDDAEIA